MQQAIKTKSVITHEFDIDISGLLQRRLKAFGEPPQIIACEKTRFSVNPKSEKEYNDFIAALCDVIILDLSQFILAEIIRNVPLSLEEKRKLLAKAVYHASKAVMKSCIKKDLKNCYKDSDVIIIEGFMRFRMHDTVKILERCADKAFEEYILISEQKELLNLLEAFLDTDCKAESASTDEIVIILNDDGSCRVTDDIDTNVDYPAEAIGNILGLLISLSPQSITVYDLSDSDESCSELLSSICAAFEGKVFVYRTVKC